MQSGTVNDDILWVRGCKTMTGDIDIALKLAEEAGNLILSYYRSESLKVDAKRDDTPVTEADSNVLMSKIEKWVKT